MSSTGVGSLTAVVDGSSLLLREALAALLRTAPGFRVIVTGDEPGEVTPLSPIPSVIVWETTSGDPSVIAGRLRLACPPPIGIVLLGPRIDSGTLAVLLRAGATGYITPESTLAELISLLRQAARGEPALSASLAVTLLTQLAADGQIDDLESLVLSEREMEVLRLVASGATNKQVAPKLYLSVRTVEGHLAKLYAKLGVNSRTEAALIAIRRGWASPGYVDRPVAITGSFTLPPGAGSE